MIFVFGVDGYIGNALVQRLLYSGYNVIGFDNFWRRQWIEEDMNSFSATPLCSMKNKIFQFEKLWGKKSKFNFFNIDISKESNFIEGLFKKYKPTTVFNLAHNPSAPYSMKSVKHANKVLQNNIIGTNNILWGMRKSCTDCHYITIGTAGEYDHYGNIDIEEGYFKFIHKGRQSNKMIFPRRPGSIYHTSKTASTYLIDYLSRAWNLRCTDVMQGVVFGGYTDEIDKTKIFSRFDSDEAGGTVINRFIVQSVLGEPLTVYGQGEHKRSFLSLNDCIQALMIAFINPAKKGEVQTWNQLSEWHSMNKLAYMVKKVGEENGLSVKVENILTPRMERTTEHYYNFITNNLTDKGYVPTRTIEQEINYMIKLLLQFKDRLEPLRKVVIPKINFR